MTSSLGLAWDLPAQAGDDGALALDDLAQPLELARVRVAPRLETQGLAFLGKALFEPKNGSSRLRHVKKSSAGAGLR
ncbi:MAG: hypothetical protein KGZ70_06885 [Hydrogenophaga sp.]|nr:hypothetical protein [Hydrogenophaga sp.]